MASVCLHFSLLRLCHRAANAGADPRNQSQTGNHLGKSNAANDFARHFPTVTMPSTTITIDCLTIPSTCIAVMNWSRVLPRFLALITVSAWLSVTATGAMSQQPDPIVPVANESTSDEIQLDFDAGAKTPVRAVIVEFHEPITPLSGALLKRRFEQAIEDGAEVIVLDIDSPGGYVSTTLELVDMLEAATEVETIVYIEREAISGAALLSLAADKIAIGPQALIGDAGMIMMGEDAAFRYVPEKERSYLAQRVRAIATKSGRPPSLAEAMVDKDLVVFKATHKEDGKVQYFSEREWKSMEDTDQWQKGKPVREAGGHTFLTASGERAVALGLADFTVAKRDDLAKAIGAIEPMPLIRGTWVDTLLLVLNSPFITGLLLVIGLVALVIEFGSPGLGLGGLISIFCFGLFFWSRFLGGTSGWFEVILFLMGLTFVLIEIFVIPGIGVAGISGGAMMIFALIMASRRVLLPESVHDTQRLTIDVLTVLGSFVGFFVVLLFLANYLGELPFLSRLALAPPADDALSPVPSLASPSLSVYGADAVEVGQVGRTQGPLRPSGRARFGDNLVDVVTEGDFVDHEVEVKVVQKFGNRVVVRAVESA
jgi:membrane-bound serine protease (ClpP class)